MKSVVTKILDFINRTSLTLAFVIFPMTLNAGNPQDIPVPDTLDQDADIGLAIDTEPPASAEDGIMNNLKDYSPSKADESATSISQTTTGIEEPDTSNIEWDSVYLLNGSKFSSDHENTVANCMLGNVNTEYSKMQSNINTMTINDNGSSVHQHIMEYRHGLMNVLGVEYYKYKYEQQYTLLLGNKKYMRFWTGTKIIPESSCNSENGECQAEFSINLTHADGRLKSMNGSYFKGKQVFVALTGFSVAYNDGLNSVKKLRDAEVSASVTSGNEVSDNGEVSLKLSTNFNGAHIAGYTASVGYVLVVIDPLYVAWTYDEIDPDLLGCTNGLCSGEFNVSIRSPGVINDFMSSDSSDVVQGYTKPIFVGLKSWGFDLNSAMQVHRVRAGVRLYGWTRKDSHGIATLKAWGEGYKADCAVVGDGAEVKKSNSLTYRLAVCYNDSVCRAVYASKAGAIQPSETVFADIWESTTEPIEGIIEKVSETIENINGLIDEGNNIKEAIESATSTDTSDLIKEGTDSLKDVIKNNQ